MTIKRAFPLELYYNPILPYQMVQKRSQGEFNFNRKEISEIYLIPIEDFMETFQRDFQFKVINRITCMNISSEIFRRAESAEIFPEKN